MAGILNIALERNPETELLESNYSEPVGTLIAIADFSNGNLIPASINPGATWNSYNPTRSIIGGATRFSFAGGPGAAGASID